jgi:hypothetical protein
MMKKQSTLLFALLPLAAFSQVQFERSLVSAGGVFASAPSVSFEYSVGEPVVVTGTSPSLILTQGFHQPPPGPTAIGETDPQSAQFTLYPNPAKEAVYFGIHAPEALRFEAFLYDLTGRLNARSVIEAPAGESSVKVFDLHGLCPGIYVLCCTGGKNPGEWRRVYRLMKQ